MCKECGDGFCLSFSGVKYAEVRGHLSQKTPVFLQLLIAIIGGWCLDDVQVVVIFHEI